MIVEYEMPRDGSFVMGVNLIDCDLNPVQRDKIFEYMKNEKMLLEYLRNVLPNAKIKKIIKNPPKSL